MKKVLAIGIPLFLVLCVLAAAGLYFGWPMISAQFNKALITTGTANSPTNTPAVGESNPGTTSAVSNSNNVCLALTLDVAKQILGSDAKLAGNESGSCTYSASDTGFGVLTMVVAKSGSLTARSQFEQAKTIAYSNHIETVTGLNADEAYYATDLMQLSILKGDSWIIISGTSSKYASEKELAIATARLVL